jgi:hypothetical protein
VQKSLELAVMLEILYQRALTGKLHSYLGPTALTLSLKQNFIHRCRRRRSLIMPGQPARIDQ